MSMWSAIVAIVAIVMVAEIMRIIARTRREGRAGETEMRGLLDRIDALEERIRVLERIITEERDDLRREIGRL